MLHLYLDTADEHAIAELLPTGLFAGVTTNPVILERSGLGSADIPRVLEHALASGAKAVFLQSWGEGREELVARGRRLAALGPQVRVKVPATAEGLPAAAALVADGIEVLVTAVHTVAQALYAEAAGATTIAPYVGRIESSGGDGVGATIAMHRALVGVGGRCEVLAASLRGPAHVEALAAAGVRRFTLGVPLARELLSDDASIAAAADFERAARTGADPFA